MPSRKCPECNYEARDSYNLKRHLQSHFKCGLCFKTFPSSSETLQHNGSCTKARTQQCALCSVKCTSIEAAEEHLLGDHGISVEKVSYQFESQTNFNAWKKDLETSTKSSFVTRRSTTLSDKKVVYLHCHRNGNARLKSEESRIRHIRKQGSHRINAFCPARMHVTFCKDGQVKVHLVSTHVGHDFSLGRLSLGKEYRTDLAAKMIRKIPFDDILSSERENVQQISGGNEDNLVQLTRPNLLSREDLHNIARDFRINKDVVLHKKDASSVQTLINLNEEVGSKYVRYCKSQGDLDPTFPSLKKEDFVLVMMNDVQLQMLTKYGKDVICMEGTHGTNQFNFEVTTVLVLDENREGFPCAFLFSNRTDTEIITFFLKVIASCSGSIDCNVFMTDITEVYYNAWIVSMGVPNSRLYSSYHVDREWRRNITKIKGGRLSQVEIFKKLKAVQHELDVGTFETMFPQLLIDLEENENTREFGEYLSQHYAPTAKNWAYCFRMNVGINTNMQMERMHGIIKHVCMKIKKLKRMDKCLHALDRYLKDKMFGKVTAKEKGGKYSKKLAILRQRHQMALVATTLQVCQVGKNMWMVCSSTLSDSYSVLKVKSYCKNCDFASKCDYCNACSHMFLCSCCDNSVQKNMCKHIHRVCLEFTTWRNESIVPTVVIEQIHDVPDQEDSDSTEIGVAMLRGISRKRHSVRSLRDAKAKVHKVIDSANSDTQIDALYEIAEYAEALLHSLARKPEDSSPA